MPKNVQLSPNILVVYQIVMTTPEEAAWVLEKSKILVVGCSLVG